MENITENKVNMLAQHNDCLFQLVKDVLNWHSKQISKWIF